MKIPVLILTYLVSTARSYYDNEEYNTILKKKLIHRPKYLQINNPLVQVNEGKKFRNLPDERGLRQTILLNYKRKIPQNTFEDEKEEMSADLLRRSSDNLSGINTICVKGVLIITGSNVYLSNISDTDTIKNYCGNSMLTAVKIYATDTIFIDEDLTLNGIDMMIKAKHWAIDDKKVINLQGKPAKNHTKAEAGKDGRAGFPGGNSGNFDGYGYFFQNIKNLQIIVNGGKGGNGQDGGDGIEGKNGIDGSKKFQNFESFNEKLEETFNEAWRTAYHQFPIQDGIWNQNIEPQFISRYQCYTDIKLFVREGECGTPGGKGGKGGAAGPGGQPGKVTITDLFNEEKTINYTGNKGYYGLPGKDGKTGLTGEHGKTVACIKIFVNEDNREYSNADNFWRCANVTDNIEKCSQKKTENINGPDNYITVNNNSETSAVTQNEFTSDDKYNIPSLKIEDEWNEQEDESEEEEC